MLCVHPWLVCSSQDDLSAREQAQRKQQQWRAQSLALRDEMQVSPEYSPYIGRVPRPKLIGVLASARVCDLLDLAEAHRIRHSIPADNFFVDISQAVNRKPWGALRTLTTSCALYDFHREQMVAPLEFVALQGHPAKEWAEHYSQIHPRVIQSMTGQAMFGPCVGLVMMAYFLNPHAPWWNDDEDGQSRPAKCRKSTV